MPGWLSTLLIAVGVLVVSWLVLIALARRLSAGLAKDLAQFLPDCVTTARRLRRDPRVPRRAKVAVAIARLWALSPIDLIPEFLPLIGPLDDIIVVAVLLRYAARSVHLLETFAVNEVLKQGSWIDESLRYGHYRTSDGHEVDLVIEHHDGRCFAIEIKAGASYRPDDLRSLTRLRDKLGAAFTCGILLYLGERGAQVDDRLYVLPLDQLWSSTNPPPGQSY